MIHARVISADHWKISPTSGEICISLALPLFICVFFADMKESKTLEKSGTCIQFSLSLSSLPLCADVLSVRIAQRERLDELCI
jgi:hypothetical protein